MRKKSFFVSITLLLSILCSIQTYAQQNPTSGSCAKEGTDSTCQWSYDGTSQTLTITGTGAMADYNSRTHPWPNAVANIEVSDGITSIGSYAFQYTNISEIHLPNTVTTIGFQAFDFSGLQKIDIPDSVKTISANAFRGAPLTDVVIPNTVTSIGIGAFSYCTKLKSMTISDETQLYGDLFYIYETDTRYTDTDNLVVYCMGDTATCDAKLANTGYPNLKSVQTTADQINGVTYVYDDKGKLLGTFGTRENKRIYTVEEARAAVEAAGTDTVSFRIRYK